MSDANKRAALAGQWRTPPLPVFPTSVASNQPPLRQQPQQHEQSLQKKSIPTSQPSPQQNLPVPLPSQHQPPRNKQHESATGMPAPTSIPDNSEDYAKALQEAYRRGAEAAAAMAAQQQQQLSSSASCPNFQIPMTPAQPAPQPPQQSCAPTPALMPSRSEDMAASPAYAQSFASSSTTHHAFHPPYQERPVVTHHRPAPPSVDPHHSPSPVAAHCPPSQPRQAPPSLHFATAPPPPFTTAAPAPAVTTEATSTIAATVPPQSTVPNPLSNMPPPPNKHPIPQRISQQPAAAAPTVAVSSHGVGPPAQQRSVSMPEMASYAVQAEEEKRQKRLARNRASARLRRLRKKNLVDAYETEVGILEKTLQQLKAHEWGVSTTGSTVAAQTEKSHQSLLEALCMDRGQQVISSEQRALQCQDILEQQLEQLEFLRQVQFEQHLLATVSAGNFEHNSDDPELAEMARGLDQVLDLSDGQKAKLQEASKGLDEEMTALDTVFSSLVMMKENDWLLNKGVQDITDQLTSILHKNQMSKFLLWADANVEAIDQLDHVHAAPKTASHPQGPIFTFGVETTPMDEDGDSK